MTSYFDYRAFNDIGVAVYDCEHKTPPDAGTGFPYVAIPNLVDGRISLTGVRRITAEQLAEWNRRTTPQAGDVILTRRGRVGDTAVIPPLFPCAIAQNLVILRSDSEEVDQRYLRWATRGPAWMEEVERLLNVGAVFDSLNVRDVALLRIPVPSLPEQRAIAEVLGALDEKIEANRKAVEAIIALLAATWARSFAEPTADWPSESIGHTTKVVGGSTPSTAVEEFWDGNIAWVTPRDLSRLSSPVLLSTGRRITERGLRQISSGLLPAETVLLSSRAPIGYLAIAEVPIAVNQGFIALPPGGQLPGLYLWRWLAHNMDKVMERANGTTFLEVSKASFRPMQIALPPASLVERWMGLAHPLYRRLVSAVVESRSVAALRDTLLPRLMSGELRVRDAEELVEEAV